ncbi:DUF4399 domain-containing protein [Umboniibacter marinipuniceus]|uniref:Uncharacterized protein DUF4399 n=1 Tax=Umboniibacter marinipuniceus TaxID=569599 RepID=A0A3M0ACS3_9GAMM|nr:DUF4399 domain-containing protein [Umboniibacter marinipuniceus]RMA82760.1 uncharacterized protein DUF4399 [Umboniibacter marinipuniceus]
MTKLFLQFGLMLSVFASGLTLAASPSADDVELYIVTPADNATVTSPVKVVFGLSGMGVAPAGVERANTGHHHLLIDHDELPEPGKPMGGDVRHFGGGQTEVELTLEPGQHTLQLILGDHFHVPHEPMVVSKKITIFVE